MLEAKDAGGKAFVKETIANVKATGSSQIDMRWGNPVTKQIADATMYAKAVPGMDLYVGSVVFKSAPLPNNAQPAPGRLLRPVPPALL